MMTHSTLSTSTRPAPRRAPRTGSAACLFPIALLLVALIPTSSLAQDWGTESEDDWSAQPETSSSGQSAASSRDDSGFSFRTGIGFTADPDTFLMNFELPYSFDRWISAGPMFQIGVEDDRTIVAPTANVGITVPDLPGEDFDKFHPYGHVGMGFAWIEKDNRRGNNDDTGFLINFGFGLEYELNEQVFVGSHMNFNFLPDDTVGEKFFFSWQMVGVRYKF